MLKLALLTLTLTGAGDYRLTLSEAENEAACETARAGVTEILAQAGIEVVAALCGETGLRLTPFEHGAGPEQEIHLYRVDIQGPAAFAVAPLSPGSDCVSDPGGQPRVFCARSSQAVVSGG